MQHIADVPGFAGDLPAVQEYLPPVRQSQAGQHVEQGGFSAAADPKETDDFPGLQPEAHVLKNGIITEALVMETASSLLIRYLLLWKIIVGKAEARGNFFLNQLVSHSHW